MRGLLAGVEQVGLVGLVGLVLGTAIAADAVTRQDVAAPGGGAQGGRMIEAREGDTIIVRDNMRVRMVKRTSGRVRIAVNQARGFVVLMLDKGADGSADWVYRFEIDQPYPLNAPWEGAADVDEYIEPSRSSGGIGVVTPQGVIQFLSSPPGVENAHAVPNALAVVLTHGTTSRLVSDTFAALEPYWLEGRENEYRPPRGAPNFRTSLSMTSSAPARNGGGPPAEGFVAPRRIHRVDAVQPEAARAANAAGIVIVELRLAVDGSVTHARVVRSIPLLDEAALAAVRQWRYEPARQNGKPVEHTFTEGVFVGPPSTPEQPRF